MEYRNLGRTGVKVSALCLGAMMFGGRTSPEDSYPIIDRAIDQGINVIDTANVYNAGRSEEVVGEALQRNGHRNRVVLATKVRGVMDESDPNGSGISRRHIIQQCEESLRRLKTDWIDVYQLHRPQSEIPIDETLRALDDLVRAGKVRYLGVSNFAAWQIMESIMVSRELNVNRFVCVQPPYNLLDRRIERELLPLTETYGLGVIPWSPIGGGVLAGRYHRGEPLPEDSRFVLSPQLRRLTNERMYDVIDEVRTLAAEKGCTMAQLALAWVLRQPGVTSPIIGPRTMEQFEDNMGALTVEFTPEDIQRIESFAPAGNHTVPYFEGDFGPHPHRL